ncbi:putative LPS assembly protein LptD [Porphyromonas macacae]|nr:putative LPS assembly protein LptD [Porphyromonas macacae]
MNRNKQRNCNILPLMVLSVLVLLSACGTGRSRKQTASVPSEVVEKVTETADSLLQRADEVGANLVTDTVLPKLNIDSVSEISSVSKPDSLILKDSLSLPDSLEADSLHQPSKFGLEDVVEYKAQDSMVIEGSNMVYFYGESSVKYQQKSLDAHYMRVNLDSSQVFSRYVLDSVGKPAFIPKFTDNQEAYEAKSMTYNFKSEKGFISGVTTQQGEGYLTSRLTKKVDDNTMFSQGVRYTTCDHHDHPHFYINIQKAKIRPGKNLVAGPANLVLLDVPLPIGLPFGFFPFSETYSSGVLMPSFGEDYGRGFFLRNGGYYFAFNDYIDLAVTGEVYTKGSWGVSARSTYRKRYRYNGSFDFSYLVTTSGDKYVGDYTKAKDMRISWTHTQDPKADPVQNFSASVNFSTSSYNHNSLDHVYNPRHSGENNKSSTVNYSRSFPGTPWRLSASFSIDQRSIDSTINVTLPDLSISMSRIFPFKRKTVVGSERWYEKIAISYSGQVRNSILSKENEILQKNIIRDWRNGVSHRIPITASYKLLDYVDLTLNADYNERWYSKKVNRKYSQEQRRMVNADTIYGFNRVYDFNTSMSASTTLYGFYKPKFGGEKLQMIRHTVTPRISLNYRPDFGDPKWGYWRTYNYVDSLGKAHSEHYSPYDGQIFGRPERGKSASISFGMENNIEAKWKTLVKSDSTDTETEEFKKISIIDNFSWDWSYNMAVDSFRWSDIGTSLRLKLSKDFVLNLSGSFDPYIYEYTVDDQGNVNPYPVDKLRILHGRGIGSLRSTGTSFNFTLNQDKLKKFFDLFRGKKKSEGKDEQQSQGQPAKDNDDGVSLPPPSADSKNDVEDKERSQKTPDRYDDDGFLIYQVPWNLSINYGVTLNRDKFSIERKDFTYKLFHNLSLSGSIQPTQNWSVNFNANYNFELKKLTSLTFNLVRDMHCWQITASAMPFGPYKSYTMTVAVKSSLLRDLKYDKHSSRRNANLWY